VSNNHTAPCLSYIVNVLCRLPRDIDSSATITIGTEKFVVEASDLMPIETLGRGAYGVVERMKHVPSDTVMAVKVCQRFLLEYILNICLQ